MGDQNYKRWWVDYPSTHLFAGQSVEVTPVSEVEVACRQATELDHENERQQVAGDALANAVTDIMADDPESVLHDLVRRWRDA